jgi:hypothetical protein
LLQVCSSNELAGSAHPPEQTLPHRIPEFQECEAHNEFITSLVINTYVNKHKKSGVELYAKNLRYKAVEATI